MWCPHASTYLREGIRLGCCTVDEDGKFLFSYEAIKQVHAELDYNHAWVVGRYETIKDNRLDMALGSRAKSKNKQAKVPVVEAVHDVHVPKRHRETSTDVGDSSPKGARVVEYVVAAKVSFAVGIKASRKKLKRPEMVKKDRSVSHSLVDLDSSPEVYDTIVVVPSTLVEEAIEGEGTAEAELGLDRAQVKIHATLPFTSETPPVPSPVPARVSATPETRVYLEAGQPSMSTSTDMGMGDEGKGRLDLSGNDDDVDAEDENPQEQEHVRRTNLKSDFKYRCAGSILIKATTKEGVTLDFNMAFAHAKAVGKQKAIGRDFIRGDDEQQATELHRRILRDRIKGAMSR
ncbi:hypothetical protein ACFE04_013060 [Oxalis oulophora]